MKKNIFGILALFVVAIGTMIFALSWIAPLGDDVTVTETVLNGDKTAAEGIRITTNSWYEGTPMKWETEYTVGTEPETECAFQYDRKWDDGSYRYERKDATFYLKPNDDEEWSREYDGETVDFEECLATPESWVAPVIDRTEAGTTHEEIVYLGEMTPYYLVDFYVSVTDSLGFWNEYFDEGTDADDYFRIPVQKEDRLSVKVRKDEKGDCEFVEINPKELSYVSTSSIMDDENVYLLMTELYKYRHDKKIPINLPNRLCGIHKIPYRKEAASGGLEKLTVDFEHAELISPMEQGGKVIDPFFSADGQSLMAFHLQNGKISLLVFGTETFELLDEIYLSDYVDDEEFWYEGCFVVRDEGDHMLITMQNNQFSLLTKRNDGNWKLELTDQVMLNGESDFLASDQFAFAYDGKTLAIACLYLQGKSVYDFDAAASFQLSVFEDNKRVYDGFYDNSLDYPEYSTNRSGENQITISLP